MIATEPSSVESALVNNVGGLFSFVPRELSDKGIVRRDRNFKAERMPQSSGT